MYYPEELPVVSHKEKIIDSILNNQVTIIAGDTGSGKTTQLPKFCLESLIDLGSGLIGCTQPRRVAAVTVAERVAHELKEEGGLVGYKIRFKDKTSAKTRIKFMTDGVLLSETQSDRLLKKYRVIILDEAHERSLNIDFLLGYLKQILPKRPDLKLIITSATIDTDSFAEHFEDSSVISIAGRTYPVEVQYDPFEVTNDTDDVSYLEHCVQAIEKLFMQSPPGDILAFLPTERDIKTCCELLREKHLHAVILPMFGRLLPADQRKIFKHYPSTKIVVATNVAETSITVPGIRYVVDSGLARISSYNIRSKTTSLPVSKISQASCDQRKGRCGRVAPGVCVRLYSEENYLARDRFTPPEIRRSNLAEVILKMISLGLGSPESFPFIDSPQPTAIRDGFRQLVELGAINSKKRLTKRGNLMAKMPIDPSISRIIIESSSNNCLKEITIIASALAIQDPRVRPAEREKEADAAHANFTHPHSDFLALLNIWNEFHGGMKKVTSWSRLKKFCKTHYLSFQRMREWLDLHDQMQRLLQRHTSFKENTTEGSYEAIHKALATGFLRNVARKKEKKIYQTTSNREIMIFPGSHQFSKSGQWILAASFLETSRLYALTVATVEPEWLESIGEGLCKYSWDNPRWMKKRGHVVANEKVSLFGLPLFGGRTVNFGKRDPRNRREARKIFIQEALLPGELNGNYHFLEHNLTKVRQWEETEERLRKKNILVDDNALHDFYNNNLDEEVFDQVSLNRYLKRNRKHGHLYLQDSDIITRDIKSSELHDFPKTRDIGSQTFALEYAFSPGDTDDGVTMIIPLFLLDSLTPSVCDWVVPGLLKEKTTFLFKTLPKRLRKNLIPISSTVDRILDEIDYGKGCYFHALETAVFKMFKVSILPSDWNQEIPQHLMMRYSIIAETTTPILAGRDLEKLKKELHESTPQRVNNTLRPSKEDQQRIESSSDTIVGNWDFMGIPESVPLLTPGGDIGGYLYLALLPAPDQGGVKISFQSSKQKADSLNKDGMLCLYRMQFSDGYKRLRRQCKDTLSGPSFQWLIQHYDSKKAALDGFMTFILHTMFPECTGKIHDLETFQSSIKEVKETGFYTLGIQIAQKTMALMRSRHEVDSQIRHFTNLSRKTKSYSEKRYDRYRQLLLEILPADFLLYGSYDEIDDRTRYLRGLHIRIERAYADNIKDDKKKMQILPHVTNFELMKKKEDKLPERTKKLLKDYYFMIQEFRLSLFAPEIKTTKSVSNKRLQKLWAQISSPPDA